MAKQDTKITSRPKPGTKATDNGGLPFTRKNYYIFAVGLLAIIAGYIALGQGSITLAPILLVLGYCAIIPIAILYRGENNAETPQKVSGA
jgi:uncharacterized membrane protein HdeD (DUF308 family)